MPSHLDEDKALIEACTGGESRGWTEFVEKYERLIYATVNGFQRQAQAKSYDTNDMVGMVYEKLLDDNCRRLRAWRGNAKLSTYLVQVTRNLLIDTVVRREGPPPGVSLDAIGETAGEDPQVGRDESKDIKMALMREAMESLTERHAVVLRLRMEGNSLREIARILDRPVGTVSVENSRAMEKVRAHVMTRLEGTA